MLPFPVVPKSLEQLQKQANPPSGIGVSEALPWAWFDQLTYDSGATTTLRFFQRVGAGTNMEVAGALSAPQFHEIQGFLLDFQVPPQATAAGLNAWGDVWALLFGSGVAAYGVPRFRFNVSQKTQVDVPLWLVHGGGGMDGFGYALAATAGTDANEYAENAQGPGWPMMGALTIPPTVSFVAEITWPAAVTLSADRDIVLSMYGPLHRRVL